MYLKVRVIENRFVGHPSQKIYRLVLSGQLALKAKPGQFIHLRVAESHDPLLRRPLSIAGIDREQETITIYYRLMGKGTEALSQIRENDYISVIGPLGTSFTLAQKGEILLIAGGIGIFPLFSLLEAIDRTKVQVKLFWGGEHKLFLESAGLNYLQKLGIDYELATMDGSLGHKGLVTDLLQGYLEKRALNSNPALQSNRGLAPLSAAACGPKGMLQAVVNLCKQHEIPVEVSLEERMACGVGACLGCVCTVREEGGILRRKRVCKEGPIFAGEEVVWDDEI
ncbi:MAG: dihydroorotate dehydrogenase electron transfer subunit [Peptococcaceae bacterium]|jgi:dihydroorotate dehydrogenase electron transfer subunit|nr:dihydroorotate dehydrogenase electron transfer subunit [Peptococcaceae bacterium]